MHLTIDVTPHAALTAASALLARAAVLRADSAQVPDTSGSRAVAASAVAAKADELERVAAELAAAAERHHLAGVRRTS